jgi:hypothetical protein
MPRISFLGPKHGELTYKDPGVLAKPPKTRTVNVSGLRVGKNVMEKTLLLGARIMRFRTAVRVHSVKNL